MDMSAQLKTKITNLTKTKYIKKNDQIALKNDLITIKEYADEKESKQIDTIVKIISKNEMKAIDRKTVVSLEPALLTVIHRYEEEYNDDSNLDAIDEDLTVEEIEQKLDQKVLSYNGFNEHHPMNGLTWSDKRQSYRVKNDNVNTFIKNLEEATRKIMEKNDTRNTEISGKKCVKEYFTYLNHFFVCYRQKCQFYFDIQHIIGVLNLKKSSQHDKYREFETDIVYRLWHKNQFNGFILRELISFETMSRLVLSSNSVFSKSFKKDVAKILADLLQNNQLKVTNNELTLTKKSRQRMNNCHDQIMNNLSHPIYSYDNPQHTAFIKKIIDLGSRSSLSQFADKPVLYAIIIPIKTNHQDIILKFGFTDNLPNRFFGLQSEYGSNVHFVMAKAITKRADEEKFHSFLKKMYYALVEPYNVNDKKKVELYKFSPILLKEFDDYLKVDNCYSEIIDLIDIELKSQKIVSIGLSTYYLMIKEEHDHQKFILNAEYENAKIKYENDKLRYNHLQDEIELCRLQLQLINERKKSQ